jgi:type I restriction enzyme S subunit
MEEIEKKKSDLGVQVPEGWNWLYFSDLFDFKNGINSDKESYGQGVRFVNVMEIINNSFLTYEMIPGSVIADENQQKLYSVIPGDVLFNRTSETFDEVGLTSVYEGKLEDKVVFGGFVIRGRSITNLVEDKFKRYCFYSQLIRNQIIKSGQGVVRSNISQAELSKVKILLPPLPEQQVIADCLSTWDGAIQVSEQLIAQKELQKKWLMQQLLTGKKRLKGFSGEWRERKLGEFLVESRILSEDSSPDRRITVKLSLNGVEKREVRGTESKDSTLYFIRKAGQFIYGKQNLHKGAFGIIPDELNEFESSQDLPAFDFKDNVNDQYFLLFISQDWFYKSLENIASGTGSKRIHPKSLFKVKVLWPKFAEQQAIASILSESDRELDLLRNRLQKIREQKKGLMQVLLTGKRRLNLKK